MEQVEEAVRRLRAGEVVAIPTETVYGLAADASQPEAVARVFALKGRPADHPLILHFASPEQIGAYAAIPQPEVFERLARHCWPGPLTLVLPRKACVPLAITGGQDTVAVRVPKHPLTLALLEQLGRPLVAPSANRFGHTSPTCPEHVRQEFGDQVWVLEGGGCEVGLESTIVDLSGEGWRVLRPGRWLSHQLEAYLGPAKSHQEHLPRVPGALERHYAPRTPARMWRPDQAPSQGRWGWLGFEPRSGLECLLMPTDSEGYGQRLYAALRELDERALDGILVEPVPEGPEWEAIRDRLRRATSGDLESFF